MDTITLQFQTPQDLSGFRKMAGNKIVEVNIKELVLTCHCNLPDIANAMNYFGAKVIANSAK
ncbi:MAG TPA: hypothetical protein VD794_16470 [Flavisolibacter sp.]|nr:hypothetical protein [Flavisolibacter sp.]